MSVKLTAPSRTSALVTGQTFSDPLTTTVAKAIIQLAKDGERDPERLCDGALRILGK